MTDDWTEEGYLYFLQSLYLLKGAYYTSLFSLTFLYFGHLCTVLWHEICFVACNGVTVKLIETLTVRTSDSIRYAD